MSDVDWHDYCGDLTCVTCCPYPCLGCGAPDDDGCVCTAAVIESLDLPTKKALFAAIGVSLNAAGEVQA